MKLLKIRDNSWHNKELFSNIGNLVGRICDKSLGQLEHKGVFVFPEFVADAEDITRDQMIIQSVNDSYCSGNVMGFIGLGDERLIIESRFGGKEDFFFQYLLERVMDFPNIVDDQVSAIINTKAYETNHIHEVYQINGLPGRNISKGIVIVRTKEGNMVKKIVQ